jgi:hypothetical protein
MKSLRLGGLVLTLAMSISVPTMAATYGSGLYGDCPYGGDTGGGSLAFNVNTTSVTLSGISRTNTATATADFSVALKCSNAGYSVRMKGATPAYGTRYLTAMSTAAASSTGTEQYGINLKANTSPVTFGANPSGGNGTAATGYDTTNIYKYVDGDIIAQTATYSSQTNFTIAFIANASGTTPGGLYQGVHELICTATF